MKKENKPKPNPSIKYVVDMLFFAVILCILAFLLINVIRQEADFKMGCDFGEIKYGIKKDSMCWIGGVNPEYCPLPTEFHCEIEVTNAKVPVMIATMIELMK